MANANPQWRGLNEAIVQVTVTASPITTGGEPYQEEGTAAEFGATDSSDDDSHQAGPSGAAHQAAAEHAGHAPGEALKMAAATAGSTPETGGHQQSSGGGQSSSGGVGASTIEWRPVEWGRPSQSSKGAKGKERA